MDIAPKLQARKLAEHSNDYINTKDGKRDRVWCGPGRDSFTVDRIDVVSDCEVPAI